MKTKNRLVIGMTVGLVAASSPLAVGCSSETSSSATGGGAGVGGTAGASTGGMSTGGSGAGMPSTGGSPTGGTSGAATGGASGTGTGGSGVGGAGAGGGGSGNGGAGSGGMPGGAGQGGAPMGGAGGMPGGAAGSGGRGGGGGDAGAPSGFTLTSPDHMNGAMFADPYTCAEAGFNGSILPELRWSGAPTGTMSFAITFIDRTLAPANMNGYHWVIWNIPAATMSLPRGFKDQATIMAQENRDFLGPCPNISGGTVTDNYEFTIYALSQASITVSGTGTTAVRNAEMTLEAMNLAKAKLSGTSNAAPP